MQPHNSKVKLLYKKAFQTVMYRAKASRNAKTSTQQVLQSAEGCFLYIRKRGIKFPLFFYFYFMKALLLIFLLLFNYSFSQETVFELLNSNQTGVEFNNVIEDKKEHNILLYANYYGGAGVGIADFNNDGRADLAVSQRGAATRLFINRKTD